MRQRKSSIVAVMDASIFKVSHRKKRKPELKPSEIQTYDPVWPLLSKRWLRVGARTKHV